jgi:2-phospho-L-lactate/phosphoenolpyruvate guanylyltransferase
VSTWALVPVKARSSGKQRLASALPEPQRTALIGAMLEHVLAAVRAAPLAGVLILSPDGEPLPQATHVLRDRGTGLNTALELAVPELLALEATRLLIVFADLPLLACEDLVALERATEASGVALAPDHTGTGTNALGLALPTAFRLQFGAGSCARHQLEAARIGRPATLVQRPGLAFDVDEPADLETLRARADPRYAFL